MENSNEQSGTGHEAVSCNVGMNRSEFLRAILKKSAVAGGIASLPAVADKFLVPTAWAAGSAGTGGGEITNGLLLTWSPNCQIATSQPTTVGYETNCGFFGSCLTGGICHAGDGPGITCCGTGGSPVAG